MAHNHATVCSGCGASLYIQEVIVGNPIGNREKEDAECPICGTVVYQAFIGGVWEVKVMSDTSSINND